VARKPRTAPTAAERARARFHELVGELRRLTAAFPELHEAVDEDDLPVRFLLRRGADLARDRAARLRAAPRRRPPASGSRRRRG
jgi:hypothetical protein